MKLISWNYQGAFRKKLHLLEAYDADIFVIQECENPAESKDAAYCDWAQDYLWTGKSKHKGLGIFARTPGIHLTSIAQDLSTLESFLLCRILGDITLLAVWTKKSDSHKNHYIGQLFRYLQQHKNQLNTPKTLVAGDWNSSAIWDANHPGSSQTDVINDLESIGIVSLYHTLTGERQGHELTPTLLFQRNPEKPFHIDYICASKELTDGAELELGLPSAWLRYSDHVPLIARINT